MGRKYSQLGFAERVLIGHLHADGLSNGKIGTRLGRSVSTISRELRRGPKRQESYDPACADRRAKQRRRAIPRFKLARQADLQDHVRQRLAMGQSPEQISGRLTLDASTMQISPESIYRFIYARAAKKDRSWCSLLPLAKVRRGRRKKRGGATMKNFTDYVSIEQRPATVAARNTPGHWEADLMAFKQNSQFILVVHERLTRKTFVHRQPDKTARSVRSRLTKTLRKLPKAMRQTITYDNGPEFALHHKINAALGTQSYFCHTHSPWEKGGVENTIGRLRRFLPRHTDVKAMSHQAIAKLVSQHNQTPRKCLGYLTPNEAFDRHIRGSTVALQT
jgi:transposase, IS30 family